MQINKNEFNRFDIEGIEDEGLSKNSQLIKKGIAVYQGPLENLIGWLLSKFSYTVPLKDNAGKTYYLNCKSLKHWFDRVKSSDLEVTYKNTYDSQWVEKAITSILQFRQAQKKEQETAQANTQQILSTLTIKESEKMGHFRKSVDGGAPPCFDLLEDIFEKDIVISLSFASCFHTTESKKEIWQFIQMQAKRHNPELNLNFFEFSSLCQQLTTHLENLHKALPGSSNHKRTKIYWNERAETLLFPYFLNNKTVNIQDLVFGIVAGEKETSSFQSADIDFSEQLQFIGVGKEKIMNDLKAEISTLSAKVLGKDILVDIENLAIQNAHLILKNAYVFTLLNNLRMNLQNMQTRNVKMKFKYLTPEKQEELLRNLCKG